MVSPARVRGSVAGIYTENPAIAPANPVEDRKVGGESAGGAEKSSIGVDDRTLATYKQHPSTALPLRADEEAMASRRNRSLKTG
jgi:hypothetical protein